MANFKCYKSVGVEMGVKTFFKCETYSNVLDLKLFEHLTYTKRTSRTKIIKVTISQHTKYLFLSLHTVE